MTYFERNYILLNHEYLGQCRVALCDWVEYWAINGTSDIEDEELRGKTDLFIRKFLEDPEVYVKKVSILIIGDDAIKGVEITQDSHIEDALINSALVRVMTHAIDYLIYD